MNGNKLTIVILIAILTVSTFGVISLKAIPVSAPYVTTKSVRVELTPNSGTSGNVGDALTFTVNAANVEQTRWEGPIPPGTLPDASGREGPAGGASGMFIYSRQGGSQEQASFVTKADGSATVTHAFGQAGTYTVWASVSSYDSNRVTVSIVEIAPTAPVSPTPTSGGGGGGASGGDSGTGGQTPAASSATPTTKNATALSLDNVAGAGSSITGAFWWILGIGAIILIAIIAAVLLLRRRENDEDYEGDMDDDY